MTELRQRFIEDMQLHGLADRTQEAYLLAAKQLAGYHKQSPADQSEEQVREFFLYLISEKRVSRDTLSIKLSGIKFLFEKTLKRDWPTFDLVKPRRSRRLPAVLSRAEIRSLLAVVKNQKSRMCLTMLYCCGLRITEGVRLQVGDIDGDRNVLRIDQGKGGKDRYVPIPERTLELLREYWKIDRPEVHLFPSRHESGHIQGATVRGCLRAVVKDMGIQKRVTPHTLRHSYATHLYERGIPLPVIQRLLGHRNIKTTTIYTHLTPKIVKNIQASVNELAQDL
jgi:integrase/recombinase XerD